MTDKNKEIKCDDLTNISGGSGGAYADYRVIVYYKENAAGKEKYDLIIVKATKASSETVEQQLENGCKDWCQKRGYIYIRYEKTGLR